MTLVELGAIGEIVGGIAVVLTLVYLAVQIRQSTNSARSSAYQSWVSALENLFSSMQDENVSKAVVDGCFDTRRLTAENYMLFINWMRRYFYMQQAQYHLYRNAVIDNELWTCNLDDMMGVFRFPGVQQYWQAGAREHFTDEFVELLESTQSYAPMLDWNKEKGFFTTEHHQGR